MTQPPQSSTEDIPPSESIIPTEPTSPPSESIVPAEPNPPPPPPAKEQAASGVEEGDQVDHATTEPNTLRPPTGEPRLSPVAVSAPIPSSESTVPTELNTLPLEEPRDGGQQQFRVLPSSSLPRFPIVDPAFIVDVLASRARALGAASPRVIWQARRYKKFPNALPDEIAVWKQELDDCYFEPGGGRHIACRFYFDTTNDEINIENWGNVPIILSDRELRVELPMQKSLRVFSERFLLHISGPSGITVAIAFVILPRAFKMTMSNIPIHLRGAEASTVGIKTATPALQPHKRRLVDDACEHPAKRGRQADGTPLQVQPPPASSSPAAESNPQNTQLIVNPVHSHALPQECCYTLNRVKSLRRDGSVFVARHSGLAPELVVVKSYRKSPSAIWCAFGWLAEYHAYRALGHPLVSKPFLTKLLGVDARILSLYIEHLNVPDISSMRDRKSNMFLPGKVPPQRILFDVIGALGYAHSRGVTHNDIKPGNILFDHRRGAVVCDWGLATIGTNYGGPAVTPGQNPETMSPLVGTPWYLCPEAGDGQLPEPPRDIFALGVLALWLLGYMPLPETLRRYGFIIQNINNDQFKDPNIRSDWLDALERYAGKLGDRDLYEKFTRQMLHQSPAHRPTASQMSIQLQTHDLWQHVPGHRP